MQNNQLPKENVQARHKLHHQLARRHISLRQLWWHLPPYTDADTLLQDLPKDIALALIPLLDDFISITKSNQIDRFKLLDHIFGRLPSFVIVIPSWNNQSHVVRNLRSVISQDYWNYRIIYVDDQSTDQTSKEVQRFIQNNDLNYCTRLITTAERNRQGASRYLAYHLCDDDEILIMLDGDDWFSGPHSLGVVAHKYKQGALVTYGSYQRHQNQTLESFVYGRTESFPPQVVQNKSFRHYRWISQHLRTGYAGLFKRIRYTDLVTKDNHFLQKCTDLCEMMPVLEMAGSRIGHIADSVYVYNVDASRQHPNSWFRMKGDKYQQTVYREAMDHIKATRPYPTIHFQQILQDRYLEASYQIQKRLDVAVDTDYQYTPQQGIEPNVVKYLAKILDATQLPLLGSHLIISNPRILYVKGIHIGILREVPSNQSVVLIAKHHTQKNLAGLIGKLVISIKIPPDPDNMFSKQLELLFGSNNTIINLK
jgi:glycosyltransferase involved in cell wall biosynthesis